MKIISWNVNGLRAVYKKGFLGWLRKSKADVICLQEIKAQMDKVPTELINPAGYFSFYNPAKKPGYTGTVVYSKIKPREVKTKMGFKEFDEQGRFLQLEFDDFILINLYLPHGGRGKEKLGYKLEAYRKLLNYLKNHLTPTLSSFEERRQKRIVLIGDFNIAHTELDLARAKQNQNNIMFTPEERLQINKLVKMGFTDTFRQLHPNEPKYTWWSYFANARARNLGWRIDYAFVSKNLAPKLKRAEILTAVASSDHCPIGAEL